jgi:Cft2 family RNA processing exonuclease
MYFTALGGADEIGASCYLLEVVGRRILIDCGFRPDEVGQAALPDLDTLPRPDLAFVTHAHLDHSGALPLLHQRFPDLPILVTPGTHALLGILLTDSVRVMGYNRYRAEPLYGMDSVKSLMRGLTRQEAELWFHPFSDVAACIVPAGHILGAAMVLLDTPEGRIVFSGDVSVANQYTVRGARVPDLTADVLVLESTYGARRHPDRVEEERALARTIGKVIVGGGVALVPSFAVGRAQEVILILRAMQRAGAIPEFPIYVDGMVRSVCNVYRRHWPDLSSELGTLVDSGMHPFQDKWIRPVKARWRHQIPRPDEPSCIVSSSGMLTGGPSVSYARRILNQPRNAIIFPGYTDEESPGRRLQELEPGDELKLEGQTVDVRAQVERVSLSAHADQPQLIQLVDHFRPRSVILVHGEPESQSTLSEELDAKCQVYTPSLGERVEPLPPPRWLGDVQTSSRHRGRIQYTEDEVLIALERSLLGEPVWGEHYAGWDEVKAYFFGERLMLEPGRVTEEGRMVGHLLEPEREEEVEVLVETPKTMEEKLAEKWYESGFPCMICGGEKRYRIDLARRRIEWRCSDCERSYETNIMRLKKKDLERMEENEKLRLLQFLRVAILLHEPVLPDNWKEMVAQRFWERFLSADV